MDVRHGVGMEICINVIILLFYDLSGLENASNAAALTKYNGRGQAWAKGQAPKMSISPTVKHAGQESGGELMRNVQISIVSAIQICKQCLQTASASLSGLCSWTSLRDGCPPEPLSYNPQWKFLGPPLVQGTLVSPRYHSVNLQTFYS